MASAERKKLNFRTLQKNEIRRRTRGKDALLRERIGDEQIHHLVHCWYAILESIDPRLIRDEANGVVLSRTRTHEPLHREMNDWTLERQAAYFDVVLEHIRESRAGLLSPKLKEVRDVLYPIREKETAGV